MVNHSTNFDASRYFRGNKINASHDYNHAPFAGDVILLVTVDIAYVPNLTTLDSAIQIYNWESRDVTITMISHPSAATCYVNNPLTKCEVCIITCYVRQSRMYKLRLYGMVMGHSKSSAMSSLDRVHANFLFNFNKNYLVSF